ncbi:unnamed protein product [Urochloa humidicola]
MDGSDRLIRANGRPREGSTPRERAWNDLAALPSPPRRYKRVVGAVQGKGKGERFLEGSPSSSSTIHSGWAVAFEAIDRLAREYIRPYVYYFCTSKCLTGS